MAHIHNVFDSDTHFVIDPITRQLKNETSKKASVVQFDHDSERFTFELPRYIEGHDMMTCNVVQVHYLNIEAKTKKENKGLYEVYDLQISPEDENTVICSWLISQNATQFDGSISFLVRFSCVTEGEANYIWQTAPYTAITVTTGINNADHVAEKYSDIIEQWRSQLESIYEGKQGEQGEPGKSAYEIAVENGFEGTETEWLESLSRKTIQSDYSQNDITQPDYIKNRIAYYCRKFDDIEAKENTEPIFAVANAEESRETYTQPIFVKLAELPDNTTPKDIIDEFIGVVMPSDGEIVEIRLDDPDLFPGEMQQYISYENFADEKGKYIGSSFCLQGQPFVTAVNSDRVIWNYLYSYEDEEVLLSIFFPEKGIYTGLIDYEENEDGTMSYVSFYKILFKDVKKIDKNLLPSEIFNQKITVDNEPILNSLNPITSGAVYNLKTTMEHKIQQTVYDIDNKKMDKIPISISDNGKILGVINGRLTLVSIASAEDEVF